MKVHFIAIGGSIMHALACDMKTQGHEVTGSDDEIYEPSRSQLERFSILPQNMGWDAARIHEGLDEVVLGMHAKADNPELLRAQELNLKIHSFPAFVAKMSEGKTRVVIAGSHGKTTTTAMIMHALRQAGYDFDYLVGARLSGFDNMVRISNAPMIIIEGDEYLSSAIDRRPKIVHYQPDITVITGIAWDHMNVFPSEAFYIEQFENYIDSVHEGVILFYDAADQRLSELVSKKGKHTKHIGYTGFDKSNGAQGEMLMYENQAYPIKVFGRHNMANMHAAMHVCFELGLSHSKFLRAMATFEGAAKRQQYLYDKDGQTVILDFAHAPSKVKATIAAVREKYPDRKMIACFELHTYSSLNAAFLPFYKECFENTDVSFVFYDHHTLHVKKLPEIPESLVHKSFGYKTKVFTDIKTLKTEIKKEVTNSIVILLMTSGNFMTQSLKNWAEEMVR